MISFQTQCRSSLTTPEINWLFHTIAKGFLMNIWNKKDRYKERFWSAVAACIMKVISNCNRKWDFVLFICCPGCIYPWGKRKEIHAKSGRKICLCIKHEPNNSTRGQPSCQLFQVTLAGSRSAECKLLFLFCFELLMYE